MLSKLAWNYENELEAKINKNGKIINRKLNNDKIIINPEGKKFI